MMWPGIPGVAVVLCLACGASGPSADEAPTDGPVQAPDASSDAPNGLAEASPEGGPDAAPVVLSADELAALASLSPTPLPAPLPDITNSFADDPAAAALGQKLFSDPAFSGRLLDGDDDGSSTTLGVKGDTGKVACSGCHVPMAGFLDNRTLGNQILARCGLGSASRSLTPRCRASQAPDVGWPPRQPVQSAVRSYRVSGRDEQLATLRRRASICALSSRL